MIKNPNPETFRVMDKQCASCIFSKANPLGDELLERYIKEWHEKNCAQVCHTAQMKGQYLICHGQHKLSPSLVNRFAEILGRVEYISLED